MLGGFLYKSEQRGDQAPGLLSGLWVIARSYSGLKRGIARDVSGLNETQPGDKEDSPTLFGAMNSNGHISAHS